MNRRFRNVGQTLIVVIMTCAALWALGFLAHVLYAAVSTGWFLYGLLWRELDRMLFGI